MVESINSIGKKLGKKTVAEFVENERIRKILQEIDVDYGQGFGLHKPEPLENIGRYFRSPETEVVFQKQAVRTEKDVVEPGRHEGSGFRLPGKDLIRMCMA